MLHERLTITLASGMSERVNTNLYPQQRLPSKMAHLLNPRHEEYPPPPPPPDHRMSISFLLRPAALAAPATNLFPLEQQQQQDEPSIPSLKRQHTQQHQQQQDGMPSKRKDKKPLRWIHLQAESPPSYTAGGTTAMDALGGSFGVGDGLVYSRAGGRTNKRKRSEAFPKDEAEPTTTTTTTTTLTTTTTTTTTSPHESYEDGYRYVAPRSELPVTSRTLNHPQQPPQLQQPPQQLQQPQQLQPHHLHNTPNSPCVVTSIEEEGEEGNTTADKEMTPRVVLPTRQRRKRLCSYQVRTLQIHFEMNPFPSDEAKRMLAVSLQLTTKQVQNWFHNKRARLRKRERKNREKQQLYSLPQQTVLHPQQQHHL